MVKKRKKPRLNKILCFGIILAALYGYGAGRAKTSLGLKNWKLTEIYRVWEARQFEKSLATEIYGRKSFGRPSMQPTLAESLNYGRLKNMIYGEDGLAEFNGIKGIQAEEHIKAIEKIYGKKVNIRQRDIKDPIGRDILNRLFYGTSSRKLEGAIRNWNNTGPNRTPKN